MTGPEISLIIPTTGERSSLPVALRSALAQDFPRMEIIVVDDSTPGSQWTQANPIAALLADVRVRVVRFQQRRGCAAAKNAGWDTSRGRWLCYLDDDNENLPRKVGMQHTLAMATGSPVVLCGMEFRAGIRRRAKQTGMDAFRGDEMLLKAIPDTNVLFHLRDIDLRWDEELGTADDACLFQAIIKRYHLETVPNVPEALVVYCSHQGRRANREAVCHYRGQRRLLVRWTGRYSAAAQRVQMCRLLIAADKMQHGNWCRMWRHAVALLRVGGWIEWRTIANAIGVKLPIVRRWMIT